MVRGACRWTIGNSAKLGRLRPALTDVAHLKRRQQLGLTKEMFLTRFTEQCADFGPTLAAEMLQEDHGLKVSREPLRKWMQDVGIWLSRKTEPHAPPATPTQGLRSQLIQIDGWDHRWFDDRSDCELSRARLGLC